MMVGWKITFPLVPTLFLGGEVLNFQGVSLSACCTNSWDLLSWSWVHATSWAFWGNSRVFPRFWTFRHPLLLTHCEAYWQGGPFTPKAQKNNVRILSRRRFFLGIFLLIRYEKNLAATAAGWGRWLEPGWWALPTWRIIPVIPVGLFHGPKWLADQWGLLTTHYLGWSSKQLK